LLPIYSKPKQIIQKKFIEIIIGMSKLTPGHRPDLDHVITLLTEIYDDLLISDKSSVRQLIEILDKFKQTSVSSSTNNLIDKLIGEINEVAK